MLTVVDDFSRKCVALVVDNSLSGVRVARELDGAIEMRGTPCMVVRLTEGHAHDGHSAKDMLDTVGCGDVLLGDRVYDSNALPTSPQAQQQQKSFDVIEGLAT